MVRNETTKGDPSDDFDRYCELRDSEKKAFYLFKGCQRRWMNQNGEGRDSSGLFCHWPKTDNKDFEEALKIARDGGNPNNICPVIRYAVNEGAQVLWMGDLEETFLEKIEAELDLPEIDVLFAPHHGRLTGEVPESILGTIKPQIIVVGEAPSEDLCYYEGYNTITQNTAGNITFECVGGYIHIWVESEDYEVDYLHTFDQPDTYGHYIGTLVVHAAAAV